MHIKVTATKEIICMMNKFSSWTFTITTFTLMINMQQQPSKEILEFCQEPLMKNIWH